MYSGEVSPPYGTDEHSPITATPSSSPVFPADRVSETIAPPPGTVRNLQTETGWRAVVTETLETPVRVYRSFRYKLDNLPQVNFELAQRLAADGKLRDAVMRYRVVLWLAPTFQLAWYFLGTCYLSMGERDKAMAAFAKSYALNPNHEETLFMLGTIDPAVLPATKKPLMMPRSIAVEYFDRMAPEYDATQAAQQYRAHIFAEEGVLDFIDAKRVNHHLLDLGCGTGLVGTLMSRYTERTVGVDLSRGMIERAQLRRREDDSRVYTETYHQDMRFYLADHADPFELAMAVHVFNYMGDVASVFEHIGKFLVENGVFLFQYEPYEGDGFGLIQKVSRYGHSEAYIEGLLGNAGLKTLRQERIDAYPGYHLWQRVVTKNG